MYQNFAALDIEVGVGSIAIENLENSLEAEVGVGSVRVDAAVDDFKQIELSTGVGDTSLKGFSGEFENTRNIVSSEIRYSGDGKYSIEAEVGCWRYQSTPLIILLSEKGAVGAFFTLNF